MEENPKAQQMVDKMNATFPQVAWGSAYIIALDGDESLASLDCYVVIGKQGAVNCIGLIDAIGASYYVNRADVHFPKK